jgi:hypothetical protein
MALPPTGPPLAYAAGLEASGPSQVHVTELEAVEGSLQAPEHLSQSISKAQEHSIPAVAAEHAEEPEHPPHPISGVQKHSIP